MARTCVAQESRFFAKVNKLPGDGCWEWIGAKVRDGYGGFYLDGRWIVAHRAAWILEHGSIPDGKIVMHRCDNPGCVRLDHLLLGDHSANAMDRAAKGRGRKGGGGKALSIDATKDIVLMYKSGQPIRVVAASCGVCPATVRNVVRRHYSVSKVT